MWRGEGSYTFMSPVCREGRGERGGGLEKDNSGETRGGGVLKILETE